MREKTKVRNLTEGGIGVDEQCAVMNQLNDFLRRRGLKANFLATQLGISTSVMYNFKAGNGLLTQRQLQKLRGFMNEYNKRLDGVDKGGAE